jgi:D-threo-aldose 1-dehydrogenase
MATVQTVTEANRQVAELQKHRIGRTSLSATEIGVGTVAIGALPEDEAAQGEDAVRRAYAHGIRLFDTAPYYGMGRGERRLGNVLSEFPRDSYTLVTKVGRIVTADDSDHSAGWQPPFDFSYDGVLRSFELSLQRLRVDRVDALLFHDLGVMVLKEEHERHFRIAMDSGYRALDELKQSGAISAIGIGVNEWQVLEAAMGAADFDVFLLAGRYTLLEQTALESFLPKLSGIGASVFAGGPFNSGVLATGPTGNATYNYALAPPEVLDRVGKIAAICARYGVPLRAAAIQFPAAHPAVASVVFGPRTAQEFDEIADGFAQSIPPALWSELKSTGLLRDDAPVPA